MGARLALIRERNSPVRSPLVAEFKATKCFLRLNLCVQEKNLLRFLAPIMFHDDDVYPFAYEKGGKGARKGS